MDLIISREALERKKQEDIAFMDTIIRGLEAPNGEGRLRAKALGIPDEQIAGLVQEGKNLKRRIQDCP